MYHFDYLHEWKLSTSATLSHIFLCFVYFCLISNCISLRRCLFNWHVKKNPSWKRLAILQRQPTFMQDLGVWFFNNASFPLQSHRLVPESAGPAPSPLFFAALWLQLFWEFPCSPVRQWADALLLCFHRTPLPHFCFCFCNSY